jgi:hypothetical protein
MGEEEGYPLLQNHLLIDVQSLILIIKYPNTATLVIITVDIRSILATIGLQCIIAKTIITAADESK